MNKGRNTVSNRYVKPIFFSFLVVMLFTAIPAVAGPMPSKTAADQTIDARNSDLALVRDVVSNEQVANALEAHGFTTEQVNQRVAQLSQDDLSRLAQNLNQIQAAGLTRSEWIWIGIGALAALILVIALG